MKRDTLQIPIGEFSFTVDVAGPASGAPVLLLHGFPETRAMWREPLALLASQGLRVIAPDQRGYSAGARPSAVHDYTADKLLGDAMGLLDSFGARRFHVVGHDWGGQLAWLIADRYPERLLSLSVLSRPHPAAFARAIEEDPEQAEQARHQEEFRKPDAIAKMRRAGLEPLRDAMSKQGVAAEDADAYIRVLLEPGAIEGAMNWYVANDIADIGASPTSVPTLYLWGSADATVGSKAAHLTADHVTGPYRLEVFEGQGHFLLSEAPHRVSSLLAEHIAANG